MRGSSLRLDLSDLGWLYGDTDLLLCILMSSIKGNSRATQEVTAMQGGGD